MASTALARAKRTSSEVKRRLPHLDTSWARHPAARLARELILATVLGPIVEAYTDPKILGRKNLLRLRPPVILAANHSSHLDTPVILWSLPRPWRQRTVVAAAADYFYRSRLVGTIVTLAFGTVPIERRRLSKTSASRIDRLVRNRWNILMYPEGTRSRNGQLGRLRPGAAFLAVAHGIPIVPIYIRGTYQAMPHWRLWPRRHPVQVYFGEPLYPQPNEDHRALNKRLETALSGGSREDQRAS